MKAGIGLDLGSTSLRMAVARQARGGMSLLSYGEEPLARTDFLDTVAISNAVRNLVKRLKPPNGVVSLGVLEHRMVAREVELPWVPQAEMRQALPMLALDLLPMPVEESVLDFLPHEEAVDTEGARTLRGLLVAASESLVTDVVEAVEEGGLHVDQVTMGPLGALNATCNPATPYAEALLDVGSELTCLVVHEGNRPSFIRVMAKGGASVTESLAEQFGIDPSQAEEWKRGVGPMWPTMAAKDQQRTHSALDTASAGLIEEVRSSVVFYRSTTGTRIERVLLAGGGSAQYGLDFQLRDALHCDVHRAAPTARLTSLPAELNAGTMGAEASTAIGLAMGAAT